MWGLFAPRIRHAVGRCPRRCVCSPSAEGKAPSAPTTPAAGATPRLLAAAAVVADRVVAYLRTIQPALSPAPFGAFLGCTAAHTSLSWLFHLFCYLPCRLRKKGTASPHMRMSSAHTPKVFSALALACLGGASPPSQISAFMHTKLPLAAAFWRRRTEKLAHKQPAPWC